MNIKLSKSFLALVSVLALAGCANKSKLTESEWHNNASYGGKMAFTNNNGFVTQSSRAAGPIHVLGRYRIEGDNLHFEYEKEEQSGIAPPEVVPYSWDGKALVLNEGQPTKYQPQGKGDIEKTLEGMWKRQGEVTEDQTKGIIFLPLYVEVLIGNSGRWEENPGMSADWQTCEYSCSDFATLDEKLDKTHYRRVYQRSASFAIDGNTLTIKRNDQPDEVYKRVEGEFPFGSKGFDKAAWDSLKES